MSEYSHCDHVGTVDLFERIRPLGMGNSTVDEVRRTGKRTYTYARKQFTLVHGAGPTSKDDIQREIAVMRRLSHYHIVNFRGSYSWEDYSVFYILMSPVADTDLGVYLAQTDRLENNGLERLGRCRRMRQWPACLFRALNYIHSMNIRHKDIKPGNILVKNNDVILTDFGIAKDHSGLATTGTSGKAKATWKYAAPEVAAEERRGRSADIYSLGCVLVEICAVACGETDSLQQLKAHFWGARRSAAASYCDAPFLMFDWIWMSLITSRSESEMGNFIHKVLPLSFLMLDPDPQKRITARQLVDMLIDGRSHDFRDLAESACLKCLHTGGSSPLDIPLHSVFKKRENKIIIPSKSELSSSTPELWEELKFRWLEKHIWWVDDSVFN